MERQDVVKAIEVALGAVLEREVPPLTEDQRLFEDLHLDSTTALELLMGMEQAMDLEVDPETLDMADFETIGTFTSYVLRQREENVAPSGSGVRQR